MGDRAFLTIKGAQHGASRYEYEYDIPMRDETEMLERLCERPLIEKIRHYLMVDGREWVVDEFEGENAGLMIAEVEFEKEGQAIALPDWAGMAMSASRTCTCSRPNRPGHNPMIWSRSTRRRSRH